MKGKNELFELLKKLNITYKRYSHQPLFSVSDAVKYAKDISGAHCKNLFLTDKKGNLYLFILLDKKRADIKKLSKQINCARLSFASDELLEANLGVKPGSVTPFALINDVDKKVTVILEDDLLKEEEANFHPLVNTETLTIRIDDLFKFIDYCGQKRITVTGCTE